MNTTQQFIEQQYTQKFANQQLKEYLSHSGLVDDWADIYLNWLDSDFKWDVKKARLQKWRDYLIATGNAEDFIIEVLAAMFSIRGASQVQAILPMVSDSVVTTDSKKEQYTTVAEVLNVFQYGGLYRAYTGGEKGYRYVEPSITLPDDLQLLLNNIQYLPPMIVEPEPVENNRVKWATFSKSIFLNGNHHDGIVDTEFLDIMNSTAMSIDPYMARHDEETDDSLLKIRSKAAVSMLNQFTDKFYFIYRYDARLRSYASGYQLSPQGNDYRKAQLNLHKREIIKDTY